jgi:branched-chain amino acid transport system ATP-binding protein
MDAGNALLAGAALCKHFGALTVLDSVDFVVAPGETIGIVGPNGAGKTTLLDVLSGAFPPSAGTISIRGADVTHVGAAERCRLGVAGPTRFHAHSAV